MKQVFKYFKYVLLVFGVCIIVICLLFGYSDKNINDLQASYATSPSAFVIIEGMQVHYRDEGNPLDSLPIVLIHGTGSSLHTFDSWAAALKENKRLVRMDLPAFGLTGPFPDRDYTIDHYLVFIEKFLLARNIQHCILAGNSLGGQIAWEFAVKNPTIVEKLILIDAAGYPLQSKSAPIGFRFARIPFVNKIMTFITPRFLVKSSVENVYFDKSKVSEELVDRYFDLTLRAGNRQALVDRMTTVYDTSRVVQIKNLQQPTLILWGEQDLLIPIASAYRFHEDLPNNTLVILKNTGHVPMEENPAESLKAVLNFIQK